ncbi:CheR family methyltransferase, partial [Archangium sp.]|uniref:CheR family methyltransferase n=1 Tax=Archangium sp. TaxID=1872627 RepID=UPI002D429E2A
MASRPHRDSELEAILEKVRQMRNFDFRNYKRATLQRRIERRMAATGCRTRADYLALLDSDPGEVNVLISSMLIKLTTFFRDKEVWTTLETVIQELMKQRQPAEELRIWSAGCATGEEAYSIAIAAAEALGPGHPGPELKVFGTDVDESAIAFARRGVYSAKQLENCSKERLARWFVPSGGGYAVRKEIRRTVVFGVNNLVSDAPVSRIDIILCRNVFIYLDAELQKRVLARFHFALRPHGVLVLGRSELIPFAARLFEPIDFSLRIYRKTNRLDAPLAPRERMESLLEQEAVLHAKEDVAARKSSRMLRDIIDSQPYPLIATDANGTITIWSQAATQLWGRNEAEVLGKKLAPLGLPGLSQELLVEQSARVRAGRSELETADAVMDRPGQDSLVLRAQVVPLKGTWGEARGLLYLAHDITALRGLEANLQRTNEELQALNLRLRTSIEELRSANEELETNNEELQSANEYLQTTNEELQSTNEEL